MYWVYECAQMLVVGELMTGVGFAPIRRPSYLMVWGVVDMVKETVCLGLYHN
jgi:hypothetical protein